MAITLLEQSQIRDYRSPTGIYLSTGWGISGDVRFFNTITGNSGNFLNLSCQNIDISGAVRCDFLSGILGTTTTGSGIFNFLAMPDVSGNNTHYRAVFSTGNVNLPIQTFSSQDSQAEWQIYNNTTAPAWQAFPAIGLSTTEQQASFVRLMFKPTGFNVSQTYFVHLQAIFAGNVSGQYTNSTQFKANSNGFTIVALPSLQSLFETADSRYARKLQIGSDFILSGVRVSGLPLTLQDLSSIPSSGYGPGTLIQVSGRLYNWNETIGFTGYQPVSNITGVNVPSGGMINGPVVTFSGLGSVSTVIDGNNIIISGASANQFAIAEQTFNQGNIIFSGEGGMSIRSGTTPTGTLIIFSGGGGGGSSNAITGLAVKTGSAILRNGELLNVPIISGAGRNSPIRIGNPQAIAGGPFGFGPILDISDVFLHGNNTSRQRIYGPYVWSGAFFEKILNVDFTAYDPFVDGTDITFNTTIIKMHPLVTGITINNSGVKTSGGFSFTGAGNVTVSANPTAGNTTQIVISGASSGGSSSVGGVTGFGVNLLTPLFTGGFVVTGAGGVTATLINLGNNISGILVSGSQSSTSVVTGIGITGGSPAFLSGGVALIGTGNINLSYSGNNIVIGSPTGGNTFVTNNFFLSGTQGITSAGISGSPQFTGTLGVTGVGGITVTLTTGAGAYGFSGLYTISGSNSSSSVGGVTGFGVNLLTPLFTGGFVVTGAGSVTATLTNLGNGISGILVSGASSSSTSVGGVTGFGVNLLTPLFTGGFVVTGAGGVTASLTNLGNNISGILVSGTQNSSVGGVTGFGVADSLLFTGAFIVSGMNNILTTMTNIAVGVSGIIIDDSYLIDQLTLQMWNTIGY